MHQYKTAAQILLILSIFNLVLAAPVVREIYDARDDQAVPTAVRNVASCRRSAPVRSDEATASPSSTPPDVSMTSHSSPPLPGGPPRLSASSPPDMNEWLSAWLATHPDPPTSSDGGILCTNCRHIQISQPLRAFRRQARLYRRRTIR
ncbi:hypothetical protein BGY98DRAFT_74109, partial [Russula aff. rugulosa BPL654]